MGSLGIPLDQHRDWYEDGSQPDHREGESVRPNLPSNADGGNEVNRFILEHVSALCDVSPVDAAYLSKEQHGRDSGYGEGDAHADIP